MSDNLQPLDTLRDIKQMMERSSRFISLSGLSGIAAGCCALVGAWFARGVIEKHRYDVAKSSYRELLLNDDNITVNDLLGPSLLRIASITFVSALVLATIFTWLRSRKSNTPVWGATAKRLLINVSIPLIAGAFYLYTLMQHHAFGLIAPGCLIFYGLALVNASKYTLSEIRYLGYGQIVLGLLNLVYIGFGLYFWALGFGVLHILYGTIMWWKYERV